MPSIPLSPPISPQLSSKWSELTHINPIDRWSVYYRLLDLGIACTCYTGQPLRVDVENPAIALQLWSVVKQVTSSRSDKIAWLTTCWEDRS